MTSVDRSRFNFDARVRQHLPFCGMMVFPNFGQPNQCSPISARHAQGRSKTAIQEAERGHDSRQGRQDRHKTELRGYRALRCRVLAGYGQQEQGKSTYPGGDPAFRVTAGATQPVTRLYGTDRRPAFRRTSSAGPSKNSVQASAATAGLPNK